MQSTKDPSDAATKIRRAFDEVADRVRTHATVGTFEATEGSEKALTVVIIVGVCFGQIEIHQVVLTSSGPCTQRFIGDEPVAIAPAAARTAFVKDVQNSRQSEAPLEALVRAVQSVALICPDQVSDEVDVLVVFTNGSSTCQKVEAPKIGIPLH